MNKWIENIHNWIFPPTCLLCGANGVAGLDLCQGCVDALPTLERCCTRCGLPLPGARHDALCGQCQQQPPAFARTTSLLTYQAPAAGLILQLKFRGRLSVARTLGKLMARKLMAQQLSNVESLPQAIVPVPLHMERLRQRGFNQALELARPIARALALPLLTDHCLRVRATATQSSLPAKARRRNVRSAFEVVRPIPVKHVAIVDDVMTTGQTVNELARALRKRGVEQSDVWVCARADWH